MGASMSNIVRKESYVMVSIDGNNNKWWTVSQDTDFVVHVVNGRMDGSGQTQKPKPFPTEAKATSYVNSKIREKLGKGYKKFENIESINQDSAGSPVSRMDLELAAAKQIRTKDRGQIQDLVKFLIDKNIHSILSKTDLKYDVDSGLFRTSMGVVTLSAIAEARSLLGKLAGFVKVQDFVSQDVKRTLADYMMLIPQGAGRKLSVESIIPDEDAITRQNGILDDLESSIEQLEDLRKKKALADGKNVDEEQIFACEINLCEDKKVLKEVEEFYESTRKQMHHLAFKFKIKRVFEVTVDSMDEGYEKEGVKVGGQMTLWHGTRPGNVLSILKNGLIIPPSTAGFTNGRLFGDGLYFSDQGTKSLNYACGFWNGSYEKTCFMFLADVAMGRAYSPKRKFEELPAKGYDSTYVPGGTAGVLNNEMIVYKKSSARLKYLVEFED
jgi:poly [ADP-ribose] polymerase